MSGEDLPSSSTDREQRGREIEEYQMFGVARFPKTVFALAKFITSLTVIVGCFWGLLQGCKELYKTQLTNQWRLQTLEDWRDKTDKKMDQMRKYFK